MLSGMMRKKTGIISNYTTPQSVNVEENSTQLREKWESAAMAPETIVMSIDKHETLVKERELVVKLYPFESLTDL